MASTSSQKTKRKQKGGDVPPTGGQQLQRKQQRKQQCEDSAEHRFAEGTKRTYEGKLNNLKKFLSSEPEWKEQYLETTSTQDTEGNSTEALEIKLPLPEDIILDFFDDVSMKKDNNGDYLQPPQLNSGSHVSAHRDAINAYYRSKGITIGMGKEIESKISEKLKGFKRQIGAKKADGEMDASEGRDPLNIEGLQFLADKAQKQHNDCALNIKCSLYLLLCWNLMARAVTVSDILYEHISWAGDALTIMIGKTKTDQEASNGFARHIYANPTNPTICPILAFAILVFTEGYSQEPGSTRRLFGNNFQSRFTAWFTNILKTCYDQLMSLGLKVQKMGTHSFRKGVATFVANYPGGPDAVSIWLRAGWSLGAVAARYIFVTSGGDAFCGRCAAGLSLLDSNFAVLPPHFDPNVGPVLTLEQWETILPGFQEMPNGFRSAAPFLLASLVYHQQFLVDTLPSNHPLFQSAVWTRGFLAPLTDKVLCGNMENKTSRLTATGIPPHIMVSIKVDELSQQANELHQKIDNLESRLGDRLEETKVLLQERMKSVSSEVVSSVLKNLDINGAVPVARDDLDQFMSTVQGAISTMQQQLFERLDKQSQDFEARQQQQAQQQPEEEPQQSPDGYATFSWNNGIHMVPFGFELPSTHVQNWWSLWWGGCPARRIAPYRFLAGSDIAHTCPKKQKNQRSYLSKISYVMKEISKEAIRSKYAIDEDAIANMGVIARDNLLRNAYDKLALEKQCGGCEVTFARKRPQETQCISFYRHLKDFNTATSIDKPTKRRKTKLPQQNMASVET